MQMLSVDSVELNQNGVLDILSCQETRDMLTDLSEGLERDVMMQIDRPTTSAAKAAWHPTTEIHFKGSGIAVAHLWGNISATIDNLKNGTMYNLLASYSTHAEGPDIEITDIGDSYDY